MSKKKKDKDCEYICQECGRPADYNLQSVWKLWAINNDEIEDEPEDEWEGSDNEFYCAECYEKR